MKNSILLFYCFIFLLTGSQGQTIIELSFTANYEGQYIPLDSILIENLSQPGEMTIYNDSVVSLGTTSLNDNLNGNIITGNSIINVFPNPVRSSARINVYVPKKEVFKLQIFNVLGQQLSKYSNMLEQGVHAFTFYPGIEMTYILVAETSLGPDAQKIVTTGHGSQESLVYNSRQHDGSSYKHTSIKDFPYNVGDELRFTGYCLNSINVLCSNVIEDAPEANESYEFSLSEGVACPGTPWITHEGQTFNTVQINGRCWLRENLNIGTMIQTSTDQSNNGVLEKYCYNNTESICDIYGGLYQWDEMMNFSQVIGDQGICPDGWHIPSITEMDAMLAFLEPWPGSKLKKAGISHWACENADGTNESGFSAVGNGMWHNWNEQFYSGGDYADIWSSNINWETNALSRGILCDGGNLQYSSQDKFNAIAARCIKNED